MTLELLTEAECAKLLRKHPRTLRNWRKDRKGPPWVEMPGGRVAYDRAKVTAWLARQERGGPDERDNG